jgi:uncharacterized protein with PIN domain
VIVVDTSAVLAIAFAEPDADDFLAAIDSAAGCLISAVSFWTIIFLSAASKYGAGSM